MFLSKTLYPLSIDSTQEDRKFSRHVWKLLNWDVKHQFKKKQTNLSHKPIDKSMKLKNISQPKHMLWVLKRIVSTSTKTMDKNKFHKKCSLILTLKAPITTAADDKFCDIFPNFRRKYGMILHENRLPTDDSHKISCLICYFWRSGKICNCRLLQIIGGTLRIDCVSCISEVPGWWMDYLINSLLAASFVVCRWSL